MAERLVAALAGVVSALVEADPATLADSESILELGRQLSRLEAVTVRSTATWDANRDWAEDGGRTAAAWLAARSHLPKPTCRRRVRLGRALRSLPIAETAWLAGEIDGSHVAALAARRNDRTAELLARDEAILVGDAGKLTYRQFCRVLAYWYQLADPDGDERDASRLHDDRRLDLAQTWRAAWHGTFTLDPIGGTIVDDALRRIEKELFDADWADAKARLGRDPAIVELARTPAQRRADALVELAIRAMTAPANGKRPRPLLSIFVGLETVKGRICELANGTPIAPGSLLPWLTDAEVERVVFDGPSRVIDIGVRQRLFTGATRRAIELRDSECFHHLCDEPATRCQADHIVPYRDGGLTTQANGRVACGFHNRLRNHREDDEDP